MAKFCPVCGEPRPAIVSKRIHLTKNQRYRCEGCQSEFTVHVDESENQTDRFLKEVAPRVRRERGYLYFLDGKGGLITPKKTTEKKR